MLTRKIEINLHESMVIMQALIDQINNMAKYENSSDDLMKYYRYEHIKVLNDLNNNYNKSGLPSYINIYNEINLKGVEKMNYLNWLDYVNKEAL